MLKTRLDQYLASNRLVISRSQAESYIKLGRVTVNGKVITKPGYLLREDDTVKLSTEEQFVSRAAFKIKSADQTFQIDWKDKTVLDVGSSTGGFTEFALSRGAKKVIAVDVGTDQMHPSLRQDPRIELHEKTDIRDVWLKKSVIAKARASKSPVLINDRVDIVVCDVSFISLREILPHIARLVEPSAVIVAMVKPQFEAASSNLKHKGVIKNDRMRREILKDFENWIRELFLVRDKKDSEIAGSKGNVERFYKLQKSKKLLK